MLARRRCDPGAASTSAGAYATALQAYRASIKELQTARMVQLSVAFMEQRLGALMTAGEVGCLIRLFI